VRPSTVSDKALSSYYSSAGRSQQTLREHVDVKLLGLTKAIGDIDTLQQTLNALSEHVSGMRAHIEAQVQVLVQPLEVGMARAASDISRLAASTAQVDEEQWEAIRKWEQQLATMGLSQAELVSQVDAAKLKILSFELRAAEILRHSECVEEAQVESKKVFLQRIDQLRDGVLTDLAELRSLLFGEHGARGLSAPLVEQVMAHQQYILKAETDMMGLAKHLASLQKQLQALGVLNFVEMQKEIEAAMGEVEHRCEAAVKVLHQRVNAVDDKETEHAALIDRLTQVTAAAQQGEKELARLIEAMQAGLEKFVTKADLLKALEPLAHSDSVRDLRGLIEQVRGKFEEALSALQANIDSIQAVAKCDGVRIERISLDLAQMQTEGVSVTNHIREAFSRLDSHDEHAKGTAAHLYSHEEQLSKLKRELSCLLGLPEELTETRSRLVSELKQLKEEQSRTREEFERLSSTDSAARHAIEWVTRNAPSLERLNQVTDALKSQAEAVYRRQDNLQSNLEQLRLDLAVAEETNEGRRKFLVSLIDDRCPASLLADYSLLSIEVQRLALSAKETNDEFYANLSNLHQVLQSTRCDDSVTFERHAATIGILEAEIRRADEKCEGVTADNRQQGVLLTSLEHSIAGLSHELQQAVGGRAYLQKLADMEECLRRLQTQNIAEVEEGLRRLQVNYTELKSAISQTSVTVGVPAGSKVSELAQKVASLESRFSSLNTELTQFETYVSQHQHDSPSNAEHAALAGRSVESIP
jgi:chromosome segregation ATPase